ncbi:MAG: hypothetical protein JKY19_09840 [Alcanivoracaceae bacterium]|nr:hypothetical protein [Alcanivoracaceae bacterium]
MPNKLTVMAWNVRTMGAYKEIVGELQGNVVAMFIENLMRAKDVDVLVIQELKKNGVSIINKIATVLNKAKDKTSDWDGYFVAAGAVSGSNSNDGSEELEKFNKVNGQEGYGIICRTSGNVKVTAFKLRMKGLDFTRDESNSIEIKPIIGEDYSHDVPFPLTSGTEVTTKKRGRGKDDTDDPRVDKIEKMNGLAVDSVRRPVGIDIDFADAKFCFLVYHCPENHGNPALGANCTALLEEVANPKKYPNVIVAGDYNFHDSSDINKQLSKSLGDSFIAGTLRTKTLFLDSSVRFENDNYVKLVPLDVLFYRFTKKSDSIVSTVVDVPSLFFQNKKGEPTMTQFGDLVKTNSTEFVSKIYDLTDTQLPGEVKNAFKMAGTTNKSDLKSLIIGGGKRKVTSFDSNTAALFYRAFISDHLPVILEILVPSDIQGII